jgi:hypothetical protein
LLGGPEPDDIDPKPAQQRHALFSDDAVERVPAPGLQPVSANLKNRLRHRATSYEANSRLRSMMRRPLSSLRSLGWNAAGGSASCEAQDIAAARIAFSIFGCKSALDDKTEFLNLTGVLARRCG